ncbi:MAG: hypothetical protein HY814_07300 [Candidatus Riflebacteria bacterium]|nr:hypothetical protein [Candidatus Riflebacteria bacterium]
MPSSQELDSGLRVHRSNKTLLRQIALVVLVCLTASIGAPLLQAQGVAAGEKARYTLLEEQQEFVSDVAGRVALEEDLERRWAEANARTDQARDRLSQLQSARPPSGADAADWYAQRDGEVRKLQQYLTASERVAGDYRRSLGSVHSQLEKDRQRLSSVQDNRLRGELDSLLKVGGRAAASPAAPVDSRPASASAPGNPPRAPAESGLRRFGSDLAEDLSGRLPADFADEGIGRLTGGLLGSVLPGGVGHFVGDLVGNFAWKVAYDAGTNVYGAATRGEPLKKIDWGEAGAAALGAAVVGGALGAVLGPALGGTVGVYVGWSLGTEILRELRAGRGFSLSRVLQRADILGSAVEGLAVAGAVALAGTLGPMGFLTGILVRATFASVAATLASMALAKLRGPPTEVSDSEDLQASGPEPGLVAPAGLSSRGAYAQLLSTLRSRSPNDPAVKSAHSDYVKATSRRARAAHR